MPEKNGSQLEGAQLKSLSSTCLSWVNTAPSLACKHVLPTCYLCRLFQSSIVQTVHSDRQIALSRPRCTCSELWMQLHRHLFVCLGDSNHCPLQDWPLDDMIVRPSQDSVPSIRTQTPYTTLRVRIDQELGEEKGTRVCDTAPSSNMEKRCERSLCPALSPVGVFEIHGKRKEASVTRLPSCHLPQTPKPRPVRWRRLMESYTKVSCVERDTARRMKKQIGVSSSRKPKK